MGSHRREEIRVYYQSLLSPLGLGAESEERSQQVLCYRAGNVSGGLDLEMESGDLKVWRRWRVEI